MAKQFFTNGTGAQQTLTPSQNEKVAIYDTVAEAEADLANLEAGQIIATPDTGDELSQPVDEVTSGNMHAVTSNAVAGALSDYFSKTPIQIHNKDLNTLTDAGFYFSNGVDNLQNKPLNSAYNNIILVLKQGGAGRYEQVFYSINENTYWYRYYSSSWSTWQKVITDSALANSNAVDVRNITTTGNVRLTARKQHNVVTVYYSVVNQITAGNDVTFGRLPEGFRPPMNVYGILNKSSGDSHNIILAQEVKVTASGYVSTYTYNNQTLEAGASGCITYIVD